jgi:3-methylcrotonyl-CoA carboxylase alpha subunit
VTPFYDPMIAKLIVHAPTRALAAAKLSAACAATQVWPVRTNAGFLARAAADEDFVAGRIDTGFVERHGDRLIPGIDPSPRVVAAAASALAPAKSADPWDALIGFRANAAPELRVAVEIGGQVRVAEAQSGGVVAEVAGETVLFLNGEAWPFRSPIADHVAGGGAADGAILSPMPGRIVAVETAVGEPVVKGQKLVVLEAMKMEHALVAPFDGVVETLRADVGGQVAEGLLLVRIVKDA